jgi:hypothetical protein
VAEQAEQREDLHAAVIERRRQLTRGVAEHAPGLGENPTAVPGLSLYRRTSPKACFLATYQPSITFFVQGRKWVNLGGTVYL